MSLRYVLVGSTDRIVTKDSRAIRSALESLIVTVISQMLY